MKPEILDPRIQILDEAKLELEEELSKAEEIVSNFQIGDHAALMNIIEQYDPDAKIIEYQIMPDEIEVLKRLAKAAEIAESKIK
jgi:hypothetical protein